MRPGGRGAGRERGPSLVVEGRAEEHGAVGGGGEGARGGAQAARGAAAKGRRGRGEAQSHQGQEAHRLREGR